MPDSYSGSMLQELPSFIAPICVAQGRREIRQALISAITAIGFDNFNLGFGKTDPELFMSEPDFTTWKPADLTRYLRGGWARNYPVLEYAASGGPPLLWQAEHWQDVRHPGYCDYLKAAGVLAGVVAPLAGGSGPYSALIALSCAPRNHGAGIAEVVLVLGMVAVARASALGMVPALRDYPTPRLALLSGRQSEILRWVAAGKSNGEIALIMGQTRRAIDYHLSEILRKLGVGSRIQAAAIYASSDRLPAPAEHET